jgi:2-polyprenyl-6-methoxyphenol hydroxylase-like FAD-dependent oxidoreductase
MTPNLGRGACEAILDAVELVSQVDATADIATALAGYDHVRRPPTRKAVQASRRAMAVATTRYETPRNLTARALSVVVG